jgi:hypothetical protein
MLTSAVLLEPPIHGAGMFTTVTCPVPDELQTSDVPVTGAVVVASSGAGVGSEVGTVDAMGAAAARIAATGAAVAEAAATGAAAAGIGERPGLAVGQGRPVALTTPVTNTSDARTPSPAKPARRLRWAVDRGRLRRSSMSDTSPAVWELPAGIAAQAETALKNPPDETPRW